MSLKSMKLYEMNLASAQPVPQRGTLGAAATPPVFFDQNGNAISEVVCGASYTFDVPGSGLSQIWLTEYKNGTKTFDGLFDIPMPAYVSTCAADVGTYQVLAYDPNSGILLGQTAFQILPAGSSVPGTSFLSTLTPTEMAIGAVAIFLLLGGMK